MLLLAETDLHLLICISYVKKTNLTEYVIVWMGNPNSYVFDHFKATKNIIYFDTKEINFFNLERINLWYEENISYEISELGTFYDTHYVFEYLRYKLDIAWKHVYLLDDGIASLFKVSMPKLHLRIPKAIYNLFLSRFPVNLSYYSLGSNRNLKNFITIFPKFLNFENEDSSIVDVQYNYIELLKELNISYTEKQDLEVISGAIITLSPVLRYKRQTHQYVYNYLENLISFCDKSKPIYIKPHPRDDKKKLKKVLSELNFPVNIIDAPVPFEMFFEKMENTKLIGMPSTAFCIKSLMYSKNSDEIIIIKEKNDPFPQRIAVLQKIFNTQKTNYRIL